MDQLQEQPIHWDQHRNSFNLTLIISLVFAVIGLVQAFGGGSPFLLVVGLALAAYSWLTQPQQYLIFRDALLINYGRPRKKVIPFAEIANLETLALPIGERLRVRLVNGRREMLSAKDSETFRARLDEALNKFHGDRPAQEPSGDRYVEGAVINESPAENYESATRYEVEETGSEPPPFDNDASSEDKPGGPTSPY